MWAAKVACTVQTVAGSVGADPGTACQSLTVPSRDAVTKRPGPASATALTCARQRTCGIEPWAWVRAGGPSLSVRASSSIAHTYVSAVVGEDGGQLELRRFLEEHRHPHVHARPAATRAGEDVSALTESEGERERALGLRESETHRSVLFFSRGESAGVGGVGVGAGVG